MEAAGFEQDAFGQYVARGARVIAYRVGNEWEVDVVLPGGWAFCWDTRRLDLQPPRFGPSWPWRPTRKPATGWVSDAWEVCGHCGAEGWCMSAIPAPSICRDCYGGGPRSATTARRGEQ
jgi:hypothetical protein